MEDEDARINKTRRGGREDGEREDGEEGVKKEKR